jgi:membrane associated rhomboid family serine protease
MEPELRSEIVETFLSRPPQKNSAAVSSIVVAVVFLFSVIYWGNSFGLKNWLYVDRDGVFQSHQYWRLLTGILVHADMNHFLSNALGLFLFGYLLHGYFGPGVYPVSVFVLGALVNFTSIATYSAGTRLVGASGVVYLMAGFWLTLFVSTERRFSILKRLLRSIGFALVMLISSTFDPAISHRTHGIGFFTGIVFGLIYFFRMRKKIRAAEVVELE